MDNINSFLEKDSDLSFFKDRKKLAGKQENSRLKDFYKGENCGKTMSIFINHL